ncbi:MAG: NADPH-dependent FMN reductase [bacterium]
MNHENRKGIQIVAISGSVRPNNFTTRALALVVDEIKNHEEISIQVIEPQKLNLPLPGAGVNSKEVETLQQTVSEATGVILATPEYHGSYSSVMKLVIDNLGFPSALSGKPISLLGVAAGQIGAIKALEHLRSVCSHVGAIVLPGPVSVAKVHKLFNEEGQCLDGKTEARIRRVATNLIDYIKGYICPKIALEEMVRRESRAA